MSRVVRILCGSVVVAIGLAILQTTHLPAWQQVLGAVVIYIGGAVFGESGA